MNDTPTYKKVVKTRTKLSKRIKKHPDETFLIIYALAGHGMSVNGRQVLLVNSFDKKIAFYRMWGVENDIRNSAKNNRNSYQVALFACCREIHNTQKHSGLFGGSEQQAHVHFDVASFTELTAQIAKTEAAKAEAAMKLKQQQDDQISQHKSAEDERIRQSGKFTEDITLSCDFYNNKLNFNNKAD